MLSWNWRISTTFWAIALTFPIWGISVPSSGWCPVEGDPGSTLTSAICPRPRSFEGRSECAVRRRKVLCFTKRAPAAKNAERTEHRRRLTLRGKRTMSDLQEISRVVFHHDWTSIDQWVSNLGQLANLTDDEIVEVERLGKCQPSRSRSFVDLRTRRRLASGGRRSSSGFWGRALTSFRRRCSMISLF